MLITKRPARGPRSGSEDGSILLEVVVGAVLVALVATAVLATIDRASASFGDNKARSLAAALAQQDQERLRSSKPAELSNLRETRTQLVGGVPYTVASRVD